MIEGGHVLSVWVVLSVWGMLSVRSVRLIRAMYDAGNSRDPLLKMTPRSLESIQVQRVWGVCDDA